MNNLQNYIDEITSRIDNAETSDEAGRLADEAYAAGRVFKKLWESVPGHDDLAYAIVNDFQHFESMADLLSKEADQIAAELEQEAYDAAKYGTYDQQVRATYYGGQI